VVPQIIRSGKVTRPGLGVSLFPDQITRQQAKLTGALIARVLPGSPAEAAGLRGTRKDEEGQIVLGDLIVAVGGKPVAKNSDLYKALEEYKVGDTVKVTVQRDGQRQDVDVKLAPVE
jgi:S1-C subfamily serine protease